MKTWTSTPGQQLAAMRKTAFKTCPICGDIRECLIRALDTCPKCRDRLRKRALTK